MCLEKANLNIDGTERVANIPLPTLTVAGDESKQPTAAAAIAPAAAWSGASFMEQFNLLKAKRQDAPGYTNC